MLDTKIHSLGRLPVTIMDFEEAGDELPLHMHEEDSNHITIICRGSFKAFGPGWERTLKAGDVIDWPVRQPHSFVALEDNSRLVNIVK